MWFQISLFVGSVKSMINNFPHLLWFGVKKLSNSMWFRVKLLKLCSTDVNANSPLRTEVNLDSVKCWKLFLSGNFRWTWIHCRITSKHLVTLCFIYKNCDGFLFKVHYWCCWNRMLTSVCTFILLVLCEWKVNPNINGFQK